MNRFKKQRSKLSSQSSNVPKIQIIPRKKENNRSLRLRKRCRRITVLANLRTTVMIQMKVITKRMAKRKAKRRENVSSSEKASNQGL